MYRNHKLVYLDAITESKKRRTFRDYFGGKVSLPLTKTQQEQLEQDEFRIMLEKKGFNLTEDGLGDYLENWRQIMLNLIRENALKDKKIQELEKKLTKKT